MTAITLKVTPLILANSLRKSMVLNPITKAARKALRTTGLHVFNGRLYNAASIVAPLPSEVIDYLAAYDRGETVEPKEFHIGVAETAVADDFEESNDPDCAA